MLIADHDGNLSVPWLADRFGNVREQRHDETDDQAQRAGWHWTLTQQPRERDWIDRELGGVATRAVVSQQAGESRYWQGSRGAATVGDTSDGWSIVKDGDTWHVSYRPPTWPLGLPFPGCQS